MSVALLWAGRGKLWVGRGIAFPSGHTAGTTSSLHSHLQAGVCCQLKLGVRFLEKHALLQRMEKEDAPPPPASLLYFSFYSGFSSHKQQEEEEEGVGVGEPDCPAEWVCLHRTAVSKK